MGSYSANNGTWHNKNWDSQPNSYSSKVKTSKQSKQSGKNKPVKIDYNSRQRNDSSRSDYSQRSYNSSNSDQLWDDAETHFPSLAPPPKHNVWEVRKSKAEEIKSLEPKSRNDEEEMLRYVLELSKQEAKEDEIRRKLDEEYRLQEEALKVETNLFKEIPGRKDELNPIDNLGYGIISPIETWPTKEKNDPFPADRVRKDNSPITESLSSSSFHSAEDFWPVEVKQPAPKKRDYTMSGAKPKLNKIIDSFGGWGLKQSKENKSQLSEFVDDVIKEKSSAIHSNAVKRKGKEKHVRRMENNKDSTSDFNNLEVNKIKSHSKKSDTWEEKVIFDGKGTFTDIDDNKDVHNSAQDNSEYPSWYDDCKFDKLQLENNTTGTLAAFDNSELCNDVDSKHEPLEDQNFISSDYEDADSDFNKNGISIEDHVDDNSQPSETDESFSPVLETLTFSNTDLSVNELGQRPSLIQSSANELKFEHTANSNHDLEHETLNYSKTDPFSDELVHTSNLGQSVFENRHEIEVQPPNIEFGRDSELISEPHRPETPPILPPQPIPNQPLMSGAESAFNNPSSFLANQNPAFGMAAPFGVPLQPGFPFMNPMFSDPTTFTAMMNFNPVMAQQVLMLRSPYFATQLLAMERHYNIQGVATGAFPVQNVMMSSMNHLGVMGPSLDPLSNPANPFLFSNMQSPFLQSQLLHMAAAQQRQNSGNQVAQETESLSSLSQNSANCTEIAENQFQSEHLSNRTLSEPLDDVPCRTSLERRITPPGIKVDQIHTNSYEKDELDADDCWFKKYFASDDSAVIPPPKPLSSNDKDIIFPSQNENLQSALHSVQNNSNVAPFPVSENDNITSHTFYNPSSKSTEKTISEPNKIAHDGWGSLSTSTKVNDGWGDLNTSTKVDDGWDEEYVPKKPVRSPVKNQDNARRPTYRQPASQPQFARYKQNRN